MLPTPDTSHVSFNTIYEPSTDSFLLLDTLSSPSETAFLQTHFPPTSPTPLLAELGTGSGIVIAFLTAHALPIFGRPVLSLGIDVNTNACHATRETVQKALGRSPASIYLASLTADLTTALLPGSVDVLVFNPPYVPSESLPVLPSEQRTYRDAFEQESHLLSLSYDGGVDGMETTDRLIAQIPAVLSRRGAAYVLLCASNRPEDVKERVRGLEGGEWRVETIGVKKGWEKLQIIRIWRGGESG